MINREVKYERNITGSFIKIPSSYQGEFDENLMLRKQLPGLVPVEKCFYNQMGQYWYNITGLQPLETRCQIRVIDYRFIKKLLLRICEQLELLELNMFSPEILILDPEYIYLNNSTQDVSFIIYPGTEGDIMRSIRQLMDFLLIHIDHSNGEDVHEVYQIYELILNNSCTIADIKTEIERREEFKARQEIEIEKASGCEKNGIKDYVDREAYVEENEEVSLIQRIITTMREKVLAILRRDENGDLDCINQSNQRKHERKEASNEFIIYPSLEDESYELKATTPTICISTPRNHVEGKLKYEGEDSFKDISIEEKEIRIGKGENVDVIIRHDTISRIHACITIEDNDYYIEDLNSTNGTYLNDELLPFRTKRKLKQNDVVKFAEITYRFV